MRDWLILLGMSVPKWLGGAGKLTKKMVLAHSAWRVGSKMAWRGRLGRLDRLGGTDDESDETNMMKNTGLAHSAWCVGLKMAWRGRLSRL